MDVLELVGLGPYTDAEGVGRILGLESYSCRWLRMLSSICMI